MLVLSRKRGEVIEIGGSIKITVIEIRRTKVRIGIEAPADMEIKRGEHIVALGDDASSPVTPVQEQSH